MRILLSTLCAAGVLGLAGCHDLTSVDAPDVIQPDDYATPAGATVLAAGAITRFNVAVGSGNVSQVMGSGAMADELMVTGVATGPGDWDGRIALDPAPGVDPYIPLHDARQRLLDAIDIFQRVAPDSSARIGQLFALLGYTSVFFGENFCAGVPLSRRDADLRPVYGQPLPTAQIFDSALAAFDSALAYAADSARIVDLARVGRGRALLSQGRFSEAAAAVGSVATEYIYHVTFLAEGGLNNHLFDLLSPQNQVTVPEREGTNGLNWRTANDPRVRLVNRSPDVVGIDGVTEVWQFGQYQSSDAPIKLASGIEARLIEAEAALRLGDFGGWLAIHNVLRATVPGLGPVVDPEDDTGRVDLHFRERAFWLFLTGHRLGDLRRLVRQYDRIAEGVFPTGQWRDGLLYDVATSMAPPAAQATNPNYGGCLSHDA